MSFSTIICSLVGHSGHPRIKFLPNIDAEIVTDIFTYGKCPRCGEVYVDTHEVWNGEEFVPAEVPK